MSEIRLQKYMAEAGVASRRRSEELILQGRVEVNGNIVTVPGTKINGTEIIKVDGRIIKPEKNKVYILLNKPVGYVSTARDQFDRKTVIDIVSDVKERIYPVGRLDYDTSGLILLTNDGELANRMTHPKHEVPKVYRAIISGILSQDEISKLRSGVIIEDYKTAPAVVKVIDKAENSTTVEITIHEGRNRQVRKMFEAVGHIVLRLKRIAIGPITIDGLEEGKWRRLDRKELEVLRKMTGIQN
jgi:23S rRNA pseudouridine2605 synthase